MKLFEKIKNYFSTHLSYEGIDTNYIKNDLVKDLLQGMDIINKRMDKMDKLIKKDKKKMDKMMNTLVKKDMPRDKKIKKCDKMMKEKKG